MVNLIDGSMSWTHIAGFLCHLWDLEEVPVV